jgi:LAO/AO transport system kinase
MHAIIRRMPTATLAQRLLDGDRRALARAISLVERGSDEGWDLVREVYPHTGRAQLLGITGPPGAGKSTLVGALATHWRAKEETVGVLSIDPSSPFTHGALLGDRIRLTDHFLDPGVFIRSMANRGALGGLSEAALQAALLMDAAGRDHVLIETVGVGQAEVDIIDHADTIVLVLIPGSGDSIQALKAGVMEIPDIIVVNKSDHPMAQTMIREVRSVLSLGHSRDLDWMPPIVPTMAVDGTGIPELVEQLDLHAKHLADTGQLEERRRANLRKEVLAIATLRLRTALERSLEDDPQLAALLEQVGDRSLDPASAATELLAKR